MQVDQPFIALIVGFLEPAERALFITQSDINE